jgi:hypothetical protein
MLFQGKCTGCAQFMLLQTLWVLPKRYCRQFGIFSEYAFRALETLKEMPNNIGIALSFVS